MGKWKGREKRKMKFERGEEKREANDEIFKLRV